MIMIQFIKSRDPFLGIKTLADRIVSALNNDKKVLWLLSGGSNIDISVKVMSAVRDLMNESDKKKVLSNLTVSLVDERYGVLGHKDSNWKQLEDAGFDFTSIKAIPILAGNSRNQASSLKETAGVYQSSIKKAFDSSDLIIAQIGIGSDGHIAGILPDSPALESSGFVCAYESRPYTRITLTPAALKAVDTAFVFAFGKNKKDAIENMGDPLVSLSRSPCVLLNEINEVTIYSDQEG